MQTRNLNCIVNLTILIVVATSVFTISESLSLTQSNPVTYTKFVLLKQTKRELQTNYSRWIEVYHTHARTHLMFTTYLLLQFICCICTLVTFQIDYASFFLQLIFVAVVVAVWWLCNILCTISYDLIQWIHISCHNTVICARWCYGYIAEPYMKTIGVFSSALLHLHELNLRIFLFYFFYVFILRAVASTFKCWIG